jgi:uncharacterized protein YlxW (UPF0749 family)
MTDEQQPDRDLPVAGRKPGSEPVGDATVPLKRPARSGARADDGPTVITPPAGDGATVPLKRPHDPGLRAGDAGLRAGDAGLRADDAGVRPHVAGLPADDEPTLVTRLPGDEATTRLRAPTGAAAPAGGTAPAEVAVDDQPTVERPARPEPAGETRRLRPPAVVPGAPDQSDEQAPGPSAPGGEVADGGREVAADAGREAAADAGREAAPAAGDREPRSPGERDAPAGASPVAEDGRDAAPSPDPVMSGSGAAPVPGGESPSVPPIETARTGDGPAADHPASPPRRRLSSAGTLIWVLLALFGFTLVVQLRSNDADDGLATARQEDLVRILSDLEARDTRLQAEIAALETSQRQLTSGVAGREAALAEADKRAAELGLLAGTLPGRGPGLRISLDGVKASAILNAVQELRGAGGEVMQLNGPTGGAVRIVASTYFVDAEGGGIVADGAELTGPYTLWVIGPPQTMQTALQIPGGVVASVHSDGGSVTMEQRPAVEVTALREPGSLQYARPVS